MIDLAMFLSTSRHPAQPGRLLADVDRRLPGADLDRAFYVELQQSPA